MKRVRTRSRCRQPNRWVDPARHPEPKRNRKRFVVLATIGLVALLVSLRGSGLFDAATWISPFAIDEIRVVGTEVSRPEVLIAEAGLAGRDGMYLWSRLDRYVEHVLRDPVIAEARFERRLPNRVTLYVVERRPVALLRLDRLAPVDVNGRVLPISAFHGAWDVPVMTSGWDAAEALEEGHVRVGAIRRALSWLGDVERELPLLYGEISTVELTDGGTIELRLAGPECVVTLDEDTPFEKLGLVDDVLRDLDRRGESYFQIDLRFADQIVVRRG